MAGRRGFSGGIQGGTPVTGVFIGVVIILVGLAMLSDTLGFFSYSKDIWQYLPLLLIALGLLRALESRRAGGQMAGALIAIAGTIWLLDNLDVIRFDMRLIWPLALIAIGLKLLAKNWSRHQQPFTAGDPVAENDASATVSQYAFFGGSRRALTKASFRGGEALSIFGGIDLDLRQARMAAATATFEATAIFGGVEIKVPKDWNVTLHGTGIFGGYEDTTEHTAASGAPELIVTGSAIFGGVTVSN